MLNRVILFALCLFPFFGMSQLSLERSLVGSAGMGSSTTSLMVNSTVGETATVNQSAVTSLIISEGFQQATDEIVAVETVDHSFGLQVFPNPVMTEAIVEIQTEQVLQLFFQLVDSKGSIIWAAENQFAAGVHQVGIDLENKPSGHYVLSIIDRTRGSSKQFKIEKL